MAERKETAHNRAVMKPPRYLEKLDMNPLPWAHPHKDRKAELDHYEKGREIGAIPNRDPELEARLVARRKRQMEHHVRMMTPPDQPA